MGNVQNKNLNFTYSIRKTCVLSREREKLFISSRYFSICVLLLVKYVYQKGSDAVWVFACALVGFDATPFEWRLSISLTLSIFNFEWFVCASLYICVERVQWTKRKICYECTHRTGRSAIVTYVRKVSVACTTRRPIVNWANRRQALLVPPK